MALRTTRIVVVAAVLVALSQALVPAPTAAQSDTGTIEAVTIHPPVAARFQCSEHALGAEDHVPDALAADCVVVRRSGGPNGNLESLYSGDGTRNEDWHGWREPLLAPFDGVVLGIQINPDSTVPGVRGLGPLERYPVQAAGRRRTDRCACRKCSCPRGARIRGRDRAGRRAGRPHWQQRVVVSPPCACWCIPRRHDVRGCGTASDSDGPRGDGAAQRDGGQLSLEMVGFKPSLTRSPIGHRTEHVLIEHGDGECRVSVRGAPDHPFSDQAGTKRPSRCNRDPQLRRYLP